MYAIFSVSWQVILTSSLRVLLALMLGMLIGIEREWRRHAAGIRTMAIMSTASAVFTVVSIYGFDIYAQVPHGQFDPARIASYIPQGVTFLCLGSIYVLSSKKGIIKGLTTAVTIWMVAAIGMVCGAGMGLLGIVITTLVLGILISFRPIERKFFPERCKVTKKIELYIITFDQEEMQETLKKLFTEFNITIESQRRSIEQKKDNVEVTFKYICHVNETTEGELLIARFQNIPHSQHIQIDIRENVPETFFYEN